MVSRQSLAPAGVSRDIVTGLKSPDGPQMLSHFIQTSRAHSVTVVITLAEPKVHFLAIQARSDSAVSVNVLDLTANANAAPSQSLLHSHRQS